MKGPFRKKEQARKGAWSLDGFKNVVTGLMPFILALVVVVGPFLIIQGVRWIVHEQTLARTYREFMAWQKDQGYSPLIRNIYECNYRDPCLNPVMRDLLMVRNDQLRSNAEGAAGFQKFRSPGPLTVTFVEVIPTDKGAEFARVDPGAIVAFKGYLEQRFGKKVDIVHRQEEVSYYDTFGDLVTSAEPIDVDAPGMKAFMARFDAPCIIRLDLEEWKGQSIPLSWGVRHCALMVGRGHRLGRDVGALDRYAHVFGHNIGLGHEFFDPGNLPRSPFPQARIDQCLGKGLGVDDVMVLERPVVNDTKGRYVSPLTRFVLEPKTGYKDTGFAERYNALYSQGELMEIEQAACGGS